MTLRPEDMPQELREALRKAKGRDYFEDDPREQTNDDDERFNGGDFDPPPAEDPSEFGFEAGATQAHGAGEQTTDWPPLTIEEWLARDLPAPDFIMGSWLSTTTRGLLVGPTGLGKTNLALALALHMAAGRAFLHWRGQRSCKVLYIDGEMSRRLFRQRIEDAVNRLGERPAGFHALSHEDVEKFAPLNTTAGQIGRASCRERV